MLFLALAASVIFSGCKGSPQADQDYTYQALDSHEEYIKPEWLGSKLIRLQRTGEASAKDGTMVQGQLLRLFGEPVYSSVDYENIYSYYIEAKHKDGDRFIFHVYSGEMGACIAGNEEVADIKEAAKALKTHIESVQPAEFEYTGYHLQTTSVIHRGVRHGKPFYQKREMTTEEYAQAYREIYVGQADEK